jgi:hypothetical protein
MIKKLIITILIYNSVIVFGQDYYRSNSIGMVFERIFSSRFDDFNWVLEINNDNSVEIRSLFFLGEEHRRTEYFNENGFLTIKEYLSGELNRIEYQEDGFLRKEQYFKDKIVSSEFLYEWSDNKLSGTSYLENDALIFKDKFVTNAEGRIKQIRRVYEENDISTFGFSYLKSSITSEWNEFDNEMVIYKYDDGKIQLIENWNNNSLIREKIFVYTDSGIITRETDLLEESVVEQLTNLDNKVISEKIIDGNKIQNIFYTFNEDLLISKELAYSGTREAYLYEYDDNNLLIYEKVIKDNNLVKEIFYSNSEKEMEKIYKNQKLLLIVRYENGDKIGEERIQ